MRTEGIRPERFLIGAVRLYQRFVSPLLGPCCRFHPTCSEYLIGSIRMNGALFGTASGLARILRCHPFHPGGIDPPRRIRPARTGA